MKLPGGLNNSGTMGDLGGSAGPSSATGGSFGISTGGIRFGDYNAGGGLNTRTMLFVVGAVGLFLYVSRKR